MRHDMLYHYKKSRKQLSKIFINMGLGCWFYIAAMYGYEHALNKTLPDDFKFYGTIGFSIASFFLFVIAIWHIKNPATYEATITYERFIIKYPGSKIWSFDVAIKDIKRFEHRQTHSHAGKGIGQSGILLNNGAFHQISMNYQNNINKMHKVVQSIKPDVKFSSKVNTKFMGLINKDYKK